MTAEASGPAAPVPGAGPVGPGANATPVPNAAPAAEAHTAEHLRRSFAYEETKRVFDRQATVLSELRGRANIVLAADAVVATLFASSVLEKGHPRALEILALTAFALGMVACVVVLWPVHDTDTSDRQWQVTFKLNDLIAFIEGTDEASWQDWVNPVTGHFRLARKRNWETIDRRTTYLELAGVLLIVQIGLWAAVVLA